MDWRNQLKHWHDLYASAHMTPRGFDEAEQLAASAELRLRQGKLDELQFTAWAIVRPAGVTSLGELTRLSLEDFGHMYPTETLATRAESALREQDLQVMTRGRASLTFAPTLRQLRRIFGCEPEIGIAPIMADGASVLFRPYLQMPDLSNLPRSLRDRVLMVGLAVPPMLAQATPPNIAYPHLTLVKGMADLVKAGSIYPSYIRGDGIHIAVIDTGVFLDHAHFAKQQRQITVDLKLGAQFGRRDPWGHGTALVATILAIAPDAEITLIKLPLTHEYQCLQAHAPAALHVARGMARRPHIVLCAWGFGQDSPAYPPPVDLPLAIKDVVLQHDTFVVAACGNLHNRLCPANLPEVLSVGGALRDPQSGQLRASNFTSSFESDVAPGKHCPEVAGPSGDASRGQCTLVPTDLASYSDIRLSSNGDPYPIGDETDPADGWCGMGGSSIASAAVAGVAALVLRANPKLTVQQLRDVLVQSADGSIRGGFSSTGEPPPAATGAGLVNAQRAVSLALKTQGLRP